MENDKADALAKGIKDSVALLIIGVTSLTYSILSIIKCINESKE